MKRVGLNELKVGNIFTKRYVLKGREAFEVTETPEGKDYIMVKSRNSFSAREKKMKFSSVDSVLLLQEKGVELKNVHK